MISRRAILGILLVGLVCEHPRAGAVPPSCGPAMVILDGDLCEEFCTKEQCYVFVDIVLDHSIALIAGGQFNLEYSEETLGNPIVEPFPGSPFIFNWANTTTPGIIFYAAGIFFLDPGVMEGVFGTIIFEVLADEGDRYVNVRPAATPQTYLTTSSGGRVDATIAEIEADDFDLNSFHHFRDCAKGAGVATPLQCRCRYDYDSDGDVDLVDFAEFQRSFQGPGSDLCQ